MSRALAVLLAAALVGTSGLVATGCGKYGPPSRIAPASSDEASDEDDDETQEKP